MNVTSARIGKAFIDVANMWDYVTTIRLQLMISALTTSLTNLQIKQPVGLPTKPLDTQTVTSKVRQLGVQLRSTRVNKAFITSS